MTAPVLGTFVPRQNMVAVGADTTIRAQLIELVVATAASAPRSLQRAMGPSETGEPCTRKLAYKAAGWPEPEKAGVSPWWSILGTGFHAWMADGLTEQNRLYVANGLPKRWLIEHRVQVAPGVSGSLDAYDLMTDTVMDWKLLGKTSHDETRLRGPWQGYIRQIQQYGLGLENEGYHPKRVAICCFPRFAEAERGLHVWSDDFKPEIARQTLARLDKIKEAVRLVNPITDPTRFKLFASDPSSRCGWCPWLLPGDDTGSMCPGNLNL